MQSHFPLHQATIKGDMEVVRSLVIKYPQSVATLDTLLHTPLYYALINNRIEVVEYLLKRDAQITHEEKTMLYDHEKAKLKLLMYIHDRFFQPDYKTSYTLFGHEFNFGFSKLHKIAAAKALKEVVLDSAGEWILEPYEDALHNGELGEIREEFRKCGMA